ncbi:Oidioi.mRNA.OKI2018_I69.XSR.g16833.t1.cds [Oikopleura dioica]|uniref:Oidioi.mRNA.OKI2018_I69.XSR.g16833.t1.cds n=1 Tax=Oikopleura dioica TaxID=34765 RepID=A0ABN7SJ72_OIKDI|nr:Oidioi.mRNA.OKI2018_I69.XSR.g16833.t1.cds [Oikopleura dioica]
MNSDPSAPDDTLAEEGQPADLERECNEETCDWAEAFEVFGDPDQTDHFMYTRLNKCEILEPCFASGSANCENKWNSYWCQCLSGFYGKDCDIKDTVNGYMCQRPEGCEGFFGAQATTTTSTTTSTTATLLPPYTPSVECDTINDRFIVRMPKSSLGDYLLGFDMMSATCRLFVQVY